MLDFASTNDGEHIGRFRHHVCESDSSDTFNAMFSSDLAQCLRHLNLILALLIHPHHTSQTLLILLTLFHTLFALELTASENVPRSKCHSKMSRHGNDFTLHIAKHRVPPALIDCKLSFA